MRGTRCKLGVLAVCGTVLLAAGCGSSSSTSNTGSGSSSPNGSGSKQLAPTAVMPSAYNAAQVARIIKNTEISPAPIAQVVAEQKKSVPATWEGPKAPVKPPAQPVKLALISCSATLHGCVTPLIGATGAASALGWPKPIVYDGGGSADTANKAILNAVASHVGAILFTSINPNLIQQGLLAARKAHIPVISASSGSSDPDPSFEAPPGKVWPLLDVSQSFVDTGRQMADWVIWDSDGKAHVLVMTDKEYTSGVSQAGAVDEINKRCPKCTISTFNFEGAQVGTTLPTQTVGYLRSNPQINYVITPYDPAAATIVPAMAQAGMTDVKLCGLLGDQQNLDFIRRGEIQACDAAYDNRYAGWAMVDQLLRYFAHQPFARPLGENTPMVLLDKTNLPAPGQDWPTPIPYKTYYKKLWGVG